MELRAPFPYFGAKSRIADVVWKRFGDTQNYVEPFAGSLAVLLARPTSPKTETVNDLSGLLTNFWRAVQADPNGVAEVADWPVNEIDLHCRHAWLVAQEASLTELLMGDPEYYDVKIAGWWLWGVSAWLGTDWCTGNGPWILKESRLQQRSDPSIPGAKKQLPLLSVRGTGAHQVSLQNGKLGELLVELSTRLRHVRVACGDYKRVLTTSVTHYHGLTAVFLDPPYATKDRHDCYSHEWQVDYKALEEWCVTNGNNPKMRIAICGYEGDYNLPNDWECFHWCTSGGYANTARNGPGRGKTNQSLERVWFSPHCLKPDAGFSFINPQ